ncbi:MAG: C4-type zinc ribbon domain-containing protein [Bryobacteraceae bacterium]
MTREIEAILKLQSLDSRAGALQKEIERLPRHVAEIERKLDAHQRKLSVDRAALAANLRDRKQIEDDIKAQEQKISKLKDQTLQAKNNEQYRAFQNEIDYCQAEIGKCEEKIILLMTASETLDSAVKLAEASLDEEKRKVESEKDHARKRTAEDQEFLRQAIAERAQVVQAVDPKLLKHYDRIRNRYKGVAIADATKGRCTACNMALRPQFFQDLKKAETLQFCESCGRIVYYCPPVSLEHEMHQKV